ncbi:MAG: phosphatidylglycerophosphatase A [Sulfolobales archaeon]
MSERVRRLDSDTILIEFGSPMMVVSTLPVVTPDGPSKGEVEAIVFKRVTSYDVENPIRYYTRVARELGLKKTLVVTTSVSLDEKFRSVRVEEANASLYMTVSLKPPVCLDSTTYPPLLLGTINVVAVVYLPLSYNALVDLVRTLTEAKALASSDSLLRCRTRSPGTVSDSVSVLKPLGVGERIAFAGMATDVGMALARAVYREVLGEALGRRTDEILEELTGVSIGRLLDLFLEVYSRYPIPGVSISEARSLALRSLEKALRDPNVWALIIAARELDLHGLAGSVPGVTKEEFAKDSKRIVADEVIGVALATYLAGLNGLFTMYWVERLKERELVNYGELGVFLDDVVSALLAYLVVDLLARVGGSGE